jgi:ABC-2 type transport system permease protein
VSTLTATGPAPVPATSPTQIPGRTGRRPGTWAAIRFETRKLRAQVRTRAALVGAVVVPIAVVLIVHSQARPPKDTLFGRFATEDGFATALLVLGFATQWVLPLLTALVAGDVFASEDQHGTWKTVLTRSTSRTAVFWAKTVVATVFGLLVLTVLAASTITASVLLVGHAPLTGLSGQTLAPPEALRLVVLAWATTAPPLVAYTCLALAFSVLTRNAAAGVAAPVVLGLLMQLVGGLGGVEAVRPYLLSTAFEAWHGLLAAPQFTGPLAQSLAASAAWAAVGLLTAFLVLRHRDITGG